ncbi:MAG: hypothetical protein ACOC1K_00610 [Nanoarchaeota archaeon]
MKRGIIISIILILLVTSFVSAANQTVEDKAIDCIENKVKDNCNEHSIEKQIYSFLTTGLCKDEIINNSIKINDNETCWGENQECDIEMTAKAIYALGKRGETVENGKNWILSQNKTETEMNWFLQIINSEESSCSISYSRDKYNLEIDEEGKITSNNLGDCLNLHTGGWWMKIDSTCHDEKFSISCDESFYTNLLYKSKDSSTIHVLEELKSASGEEGNITEQIESLCFKGTSGFCDYEGTLWATLVLNNLGENVDSYFPYITSKKNEEDYNKYLPESFLYLLTGDKDFEEEIFEKQYPGGYWDTSSGKGKYYDTAIALQPFYNDDFEEKTKAKQALEKDQGEDGCWNGGHVRDTGIILHNIYGVRTSVSGDSGITKENCEDNEGYCMSDSSCLEAQGDSLDEYYCEGAYDICCDTPLEEETCEDKDGVICDSDQECSGSTEETDDLLYGQTCCVQGECKDTESQKQENTCIDNGGSCRYECESGEEETFSYSCNDDSKLCCVEKEGGSLWWIWLLLILIILVILGIIFRDKLRPLYMRVKSNKFFSSLLSKFSKKNNKNIPPRRPGFPGGAPRQAPPRRMPPPRARRPVHPPQKKRPPQEKEDEKKNILDKLKDIGK